jgi:hypothetical protein
MATAARRGHGEGSVYRDAANGTWADLGEAFPAWRTPGRDAILQPPKPQITPSATILQLVAGHDTEPEAGD